MNHRWVNNTCINCGVTRERKSWKLRRAITIRDHYQYGTGWWYGEVNKFKRPDCKKEK